MPDTLRALHTQAQHLPQEARESYRPEVADDVIAQYRALDDAFQVPGAAANWAVFGGSLLLYFTNLMTIALTATVMAWLYGFRSYLSERQTQFQIFGMVVVFVGLAIPLGISLVQIGHEANISRSANGYIKDQFGPRARVSQIDIDFNVCKSI